MEIFNLDKTMKLPILEINCCTIGNFDGVHLGHQKLINSTKETGFKSLVITFDNLHKEHILSLDEKINKINDLNIDYLIILKYEDFKDMFYTEFIKMMSKMKVKKVCIGKDFRFGFKKEGDYIDLDNKFELNIIKEVLINETRVSSTKIRELLKSGDINSVNELLGYNFYIKSTVLPGNELGRTIGFPTANLELDIMLKVGVYKTITYVDDIAYNSITNVGYNPTFNKQDIIKIETNILNFNQDIYNKEIKVEFINKIRDEVKFSSKEELITQLNKDKLSWS